MSKKKSLYGKKLPIFTKGKVIRLLLFVIFVTVGFTLNRYVPAIQTFGWGFAFGMVCMAALTG
jgi:hypothetical protein